MTVLMTILGIIIVSIPLAISVVGTPRRSPPARMGVRPRGPQPPRLGGRMRHRDPVQRGRSCRVDLVLGEGQAQRCRGRIWADHAGRLGRPPTIRTRMMPMARVLRRALAVLTASVLALTFVPVLRRAGGGRARARRLPPRRLGDVGIEGRGREAVRRLAAHVRRSGQPFDARRRADRRRATR